MHYCLLTYGVYCTALLIVVLSTLDRMWMVLSFSGVGRWCICQQNVWRETVRVKEEVMLRRKKMNQLRWNYKYIHIHVGTRKHTLSWTILLQPRHSVIVCYLWSTVYVLKSASHEHTQRTFCETICSGFLYCKSASTVMWSHPLQILHNRLKPTV